MFVYSFSVAGVTYFEIFTTSLLLDRGKWLCQLDGKCNTCYTSGMDLSPSDLWEGITEVMSDDKKEETPPSEPPADSPSDETQEAEPEVTESKVKSWISDALAAFTKPVETTESITVLETKPEEIKVPETPAPKPESKPRYAMMRHHPR